MTLAILHPSLSRGSATTVELITEIVEILKDPFGFLTSLAKDIQ